ncbi:hypothetical protein LZ32DRAFT_601560 [Colletotrichum eremochloae]|nr:hypothetical protein LZ32DRAFT_601560 [Colletotrichum eremochloae]
MRRSCLDCLPTSPPFSLAISLTFPFIPLIIRFTLSDYLRTPIHLAVSVNEAN